MENWITKDRELNILRYVVNNSEEEMSACTVDGRFVFANDLMKTNHQLSSDFPSHSIHDLNVVEFVNGGWDKFLNDIRANGGSLRTIVRKELKNKSRIHYEIKCNITVANGGELVWIFANDITEKVLQNNKIKELNYVMEAILNNIPVCLFVKDTGKDFRYIYWNKAFEMFSKIPSSKALGNTDFEVFPNRADAEKFRKDDLTVLHKGAPIEFDEEYIDADGNTRYCHTLKALIASDQELPWLIGVTWDITELKRTERELIAARHRAEQSDKLKSTFLANMSHEIRTPLNAIVGFSKLLSEADKEESAQYFNIIDGNANLLLQLINDILDISKIEAGTLEFVESIVNVGDMFSDIYEMNRYRTNENVQLIHDLYQSPIIIRCDRNRLLQVITNLINNAIKFTQVGEIRFGYYKKNKSLEFYVKDTGMGISQKFIDTIFSRFIKLNSFVQGTGLGLSICQTIIERMGGEIWVESVENEGSTFYFSVPYSENCEIEVSAVVDGRKKIVSKNGKRKTILVVEDIETHCRLIDGMLHTNYDIINSRDGREAVSMCKSKNPDLILMDVKLPEMNGLQAVTEIRKFSDVPIVAMTSYAYDSDRKDAYDCGCNDFISKPISQDLLRKIIEKYI